MHPNNYYMLGTLTIVYDSYIMNIVTYIWYNIKISKIVYNDAKPMLVNIVVTSAT